MDKIVVAGIRGLATGLGEMEQMLHKAEAQRDAALADKRELLSAYGRITKENTALQELLARASDTKAASARAIACCRDPQIVAQGPSAVIAALILAVLHPLLPENRHV